MSPEMALIHVATLAIRHTASPPLHMRQVGFAFYFFGFAFISSALPRTLHPWFFRVTAA